MTGRDAVIGGSGRCLQGRIATTIAVWTTFRQRGCEMEPSVKGCGTGANRFGADSKCVGQKGSMELGDEAEGATAAKVLKKQGFETMSVGRAKVCSMINWRYFLFSVMFRRYTFE